MKILITGANGSVGEILIDKLLGSGFNDLVILSRKRIQKNSIPTILGDLENYQSLLSASTGIDTIIHLAATTHSSSSKKYFSTNTEGTKNLLVAAQQNSVPNFIFISSTSASEEGGAYAYSKLLAEKEVKKYQYNWTIIRISEIYGINNGKEAIQKLIEKIKKSYFIFIPRSNNAKLCPVHIEDIINTIIYSLTTQDKKSEYILAGPQCFTYEEFCKKVAEEYQKKIQLIRVPIWIIKIAAFLLPGIIVSDQVPRLLVKKSYDITTASKCLNFKPRKFSAKNSLQ